MDTKELDTDVRSDLVFGEISRETAERRTRLRNEEHKLEDARRLLGIMKKTHSVTAEAEELLREYPHLQREFRDLLDRIQAE